MQVQRLKSHFSSCAQLLSLLRYVSSTKRSYHLLTAGLALCVSQISVERCILLTLSAHQLLAGRRGCRARNSLNMQFGLCIGALLALLTLSVSGANAPRNPNSDADLLPGETGL